MAGIRVLSTSFILFLTSPLFAKDLNYVCSGKMRAKKVTVAFTNYADENESARADLRVSIGNETKVHRNLSVFGGDEGFDYGVSGRGFQFLLVLPPNWLPGRQVGAILNLFTAGRTTEARLACRERRIDF